MDNEYDDSDQVQEILSESANKTKVESNIPDSSLSGPILCLPPEVLGNIFELGRNMITEDALEEEDVESRTTLGFELAVSQTCRYFRATALQFANLWTSIEIRGEATLQWASICIGRAGTCYLDIFIDCSDGTLANSAALEYMLRVIVPHSRRWRSLTMLSCCERLSTPMITNICSQPAPALQYLSLEVNDVELIDRFDLRRGCDIPQIFETGTPKLTFVRLRGFAIQFCRPQLDKVVTLHLDDTMPVPISYLTFRGIVTQSVHLEHLSIFGDFIDRQSWPGRANVARLPRLRSLRLCGVGKEVYAGVLLGFDTPLLQFLTLKDLQEEDLDTLWELNERSRYENLTHLTFSNFNLSQATYRRLCQTFYNIVSFSVLRSNIVECSMMLFLLEGQVLDQNGHPFIPWPNLKELCFAYDGTEEEDAFIQSLVRLRGQQGSNAISRFRLRVDPEYVDEEAIREILSPEDIAICESFSGNEVWPHNRSFFDFSDISFS